MGVHMLEDDSSDKALGDYGIIDGCMLTLIKRTAASVLTSSLDCTAKVWNAATGECVLTLSGHGDGVTSAVFSPDGSSVLTRFVAETAKIWNAATGECTQTFIGHSDRWVVHVGFLQDVAF